jgi:hypothetical protein
MHGGTLVTINDNRDSANADSFIRGQELLNKPFWMGHVVSKGVFMSTSRDPYFNFEEWRENEIWRYNLTALCGFVQVDADFRYYAQDCDQLGNALCEKGT